MIKHELLPHSQIGKLKLASKIYNGDQAHPSTKQHFAQTFWLASVVQMCKGWQSEFAITLASPS